MRQRERRRGSKTEENRGETETVCGGRTRGGKWRRKRKMRSERQKRWQRRS